MSKKQPEVWFQTLTIEVQDPDTGEKVRRVFAGQSLFTPEQVERLKDHPIESLITDFEISRPENPYEESENMKAHASVVETIRKAVEEGRA